MADALVSAVVQQLTSIIEAEIQQEGKLLFGGHDEAEDLASTLTAIRAVLNDAEKKQVKESESSVRLWLDKLKAVSYDLEDVLDEWNARISGPNKVEKMGNSKFVRLPNFLSPFFCFNQVVMSRDIGMKMKKIKERLDVIAKEKDRYQFVVGGKNGVEEEEGHRHEETTPLIDVSEVCGRDLDKDTIVRKLCEGIGEDGSGPLVVSIVGMGGMGKTTLAQLAFNDDRVNAHFEHKIWVSVSKPFDKTQIAKIIINAVDGLRPYLFWHGLQEEQYSIWHILQEQLQNCVKGKKFLLVLDDVWTDDFRLWDPIKIPLKSGAFGSRILVTTRNEGVSIMMEATYMLPLGTLSPEDSWSLFSKLAFYGKSREDRNNLVDIGSRISDKCEGLPLAIKTLGSLMRFKETKQAWENVFHSELWELEAVERGIFRALFLSYYDLPSPMQRCFSYCAIFPRNYKIEKDTLIQHWMAQGFLVPTGSVEMEQIGAEYFDNLVMRSFFQDLERDKDDQSKITCTMHEIVQGLAQSLMKNECFIMDFDGENVPALDSLCRKARHLTLMGRKEEFHSCIYNLRSLRTLHVLQKEIKTAPPGLFHCLASLRGLDLSHTSITALPTEVGKLFHLRWLNLSRLELVELPDKLCNLYNLQTLNLYRCRRLLSLPRSLGKLINLRYLNIKETDSLSILPQGIGRLSNLRTLCKFSVGENGEGCNIAELKSLNRLRGHLEISGLEKVMDVDRAIEAELKNKEHLRSLELVFSFGVTEVMENVIEALQPNPNLEALQVYDYGGSILPTWITMVTKLKDLKLLNCANCQELPPLGKLPSLEKLLIGHFNNVKRVGVEFLGVDPATERNNGTESVVMFPNLRELTFRYMVDWEKWDTASISAATARRTMPCLRSLSLYDCPKLEEIPQYLQIRPLEELIISRCPILEQQRQ